MSYTREQLLDIFHKSLVPCQKITEINQYGVTRKSVKRDGVLFSIALDDQDSSQDEIEIHYFVQEDLVVVHRYYTTGLHTPDVSFEVYHVELRGDSIWFSSEKELDMETANYFFTDIKQETSLDPEEFRYSAKYENSDLIPLNLEKVSNNKDFLNLFSQNPLLRSQNDFQVSFVDIPLETI